MKTINAYNFRNTCSGYPTQFEFEDEFNNKYYFRLRFGGWALYNYSTWEIITSGEYGHDLEGFCTKKTFLKLLRRKGYNINIIKRRK